MDLEQLVESIYRCWIKLSKVGIEDEHALRVSDATEVTVSRKRYPRFCRLKRTGVDVEGLVEVDVCHGYFSYDCIRSSKQKRRRKRASETLEGWIARASEGG
jgi:hypothetical protein